PLPGWTRTTRRTTSSAASRTRGARSALLLQRREPRQDSRSCRRRRTWRTPRRRRSRRGCSTAAGTRSTGPCSTPTSSWGAPSPRPPTSPTPLPGEGTIPFLPRVDLPGSTRFGEPSIAIAPDGTVWVTAPRGVQSSVTSGQASPVWRSDDRGQSFAGPITTANLGSLETGVGGGDADVKTDASGNVYQLDLWLGNDAISGSQDKGQTWTRSTLSHR